MEEQIISVGAVFIGIGGMVFLFGLTYIALQFGRAIKYSSDYEERITTFEIAVLDKLALKKGIDLRKEIEQNRLLVNRSFRKRIREQMYEEMFGQDNKK